uniref:Uncharacterized protein n=1 Tax=Amphimedon queenslandica TaxID=400682 RepID=A0A1X7UND2_AMPQE
MATSSSSPAPFKSVCNKELSKKAFYAVYDRIKPLAAGWKQIAISWHLEIDTINRIEADCRGDTIACLQKVIEFWLKKDYDYESHGIPCWRRVCVAVKEGGGDPALADEIAREHPLTATTGGATFIYPLPVGRPTDNNHRMSPSVRSFIETGGGGESISIDDMSYEGDANTIDSNHSAMNYEQTVPSTECASNRNEDAPNFISEKNFLISSKLHDLQKEFNEAVRKMKKSFKHTDLPKIIDYLETHVLSLLGPEKKQQTTAQAIREEFYHIKTISQLFNTLQDKYVSWFNYELLTDLIRVFQKRNRSLIRTWSEYEEKLNDYFINGGGLLKGADAVQFGITDVPPGTRVMIARVDRSDYTLDHLFFFRRAIPKELGVSEMRFYFSVVTPGSLQFKHLIPEYLYSLLFPLTTKLQQQLASIGITEVTFGEDKYDLREFSKKEVKHSSTDIDICDPLWYENTSTPLHEAAWRGLKDEIQWLLNKFGYSTFHRGLHGWTPLHSASYGGHIEILQQLIHQYGIDPNEGDDNSVSSIHMASYKGHLSIVQYLVDTCHVPPDQPDNSNNTALLYSAMGGHSDLVEFFIERNCNTSQINRENVSLSLFACKSGELALVHKLESLNLFSPDEITISGSGILHFTCYSMNNKSVKLFKYLLNQYQLSIDVKDRYGRTPLHIASWYASSSVVEYIVSIQGNEALLVTDNNGYSCLHYTCDADNKGRNFIHFSSLEGHTHFIKHITSQNLQYISLLHSTDNDGKIPLHFACQSGNIQLVTFLINDMKCDVNAKDTRDQTCVTFTCFSGNLDLVQLLIQQYKLEPLATDKYGVTALHGAAQNGHTHILKWYSQEYSVDITNHTNNNKYTLAHAAAYKGRLHCLQELINKYQCDVNATTTDTGSTVLLVACKGGHVPVVLYLTSLPQCNVAAKTSNGSTVLHITCQYSDSLPILKHLVENHQLDLCAVNDEGMAPIHLACKKGRLNLIQYIIEHIPSSLELPQSKHGRTPFLIAVYFNQLEVIKYLISKKCNLSATDDKGSGAVHTSVARGHLNVLKYLIDNNYCNPNATNHQDHN